MARSTSLISGKLFITYKSYKPKAKPLLSHQNRLMDKHKHQDCNTTGKKQKLVSHTLLIIQPVCVSFNLNEIDTLISNQLYLCHEDTEAAETEKKDPVQGEGELHLLDSSS